MSAFIKPINGYFYVFIKDQYGNLYDTMHHFKQLAQAKAFIEGLGYEQNS